MVDWKNCKGASIIWNGFKNIWPIFYSLPRWNFCTGDKILIGQARLRGNPKHFSCSRHPLSILNGKGIFFLSQVMKEQVNGIPIWFSADGLQLLDSLLPEWNAFTTDLKSRGFSWN